MRKEDKRNLWLLLVLGLVVAIYVALTFVRAWQRVDFYETIAEAISFGKGDKD